MIPSCLVEQRRYLKAIVWSSGGFSSIHKMYDLLQRLEILNLDTTQEMTIISLLYAVPETATYDELSGGPSSTYSDDSSTVDQGRAEVSSSSTPSFQQRLRSPLHLIADNARYHVLAIAQIDQRSADSQAEEMSITSGYSLGTYVHPGVMSWASGCTIEEIESGAATGEPTAFEDSPAYYLQLAQDTPDSPEVTDILSEAEDIFAFQEWIAGLQGFTPPSTNTEVESASYAAF